jgi:hypothetical protein
VWVSLASPCAVAMNPVVGSLSGARVGASGGMVVVGRGMLVGGLGCTVVGCPGVVVTRFQWTSCVMVWWMVLGATR